MEDKGFSIAAFFLVSGISFFGFSKAILLLDGENIPLFTWMGIFFIIVGGTLLLKEMKLRRKSDN